MVFAQPEGNSIPMVAKYRVETTFSLVLKWKMTNTELHVSIKPLQTKTKTKIFTQSFVHVTPEFKSHNHWEIIKKKNKF